MRIRICAVGRLKAGPEKALINDYLTRFDRTGRAFGLGPAEVVEVDERKAQTKPAQAEALARLIPGGAVVACLDERGKVLTSPQFSKRLQSWADQGAGDLCLLIGGADGLDRSLLDRAALSLSFGAMVWPHMLARVMLTEQLYRAATILAGSPYHRV